MSPEELKSRIKSRGKGTDENTRYEEWLELMTNPNHAKDEAIPELEKHDGGMSNAVYQDYMDVTLSLSMNLCPKCLAGVFQEPVDNCGVLVKFSCVRFSAEHYWFRSLPLMLDSGDEHGL